MTAKTYLYECFIPGCKAIARALLFVGCWVLVMAIGVAMLAFGCSHA